MSFTAKEAYEIVRKARSLGPIDNILNSIKKQAELGNTSYRASFSLSQYTIQKKKPVKLFL